jgi:hypothetical protein
MQYSGKTAVDRRKSLNDSSEFYGPCSKILQTDTKRFANFILFTRLSVCHWEGRVMKCPACQIAAVSMVTGYNASLLNMAPINMRSLYYKVHKIKA